MTNRAHIINRAVGALVGQACGDALGAPHEFGPPLPADFALDMTGGGSFGWAPGEWTDDTAMSIPIARAVAEHRNLDDPGTLADIVTEWIDWAATANDVGVQTRQVLSALRGGVVTETTALEASRSIHERSGRSGGNGALMRTAPVTLAFVDNVSGLTEATTRVARLTHWEDAAAEACVIWCHAIRHAIVTGELDLEPGVQELAADRADYWRGVIADAEAGEPSDFCSNNGWVVAALQGAWSAIVRGRDAGETVVGMIERAVRGGGDTDTVAAIAGALAGAASGVSAIPARWRRPLHGWPELSYRDLVTLAVQAVGGERSNGWPTAERVVYDWAPDTFVQHPHDDGVWIGSITVLDRLPEQIDAVVSMCQTGAGQAGVEAVDFWLIDDDGANLNLDFVLRDAADTVAALRAEGKNVFLHCVAAQSRTPNTAVAYSVLHCGVGLEQAIADVNSVTPLHATTRDLPAAVARLAATVNP